MKSPAPHTAIIRFGVFEFNPAKGELRKNGLRVRLSQQSAKLLHMLLKAKGDLCTREELRRQLWPADTFVDFEHSLNKAVWGLRQALGDFVASPRYIETVPGQGYRFLVLSVQPAQPSARPGKTRALESLAVVPPVNVTGAEECGFLAGQLASRLINILCGDAKLRVLAYSTVKQYNQAGKEPRVVGQELGVQGVLAGEILRHNGDLIINLELIDVTDGAQIWGTQMIQAWPQTGDLAEILAEQIARQLQPVLAARRKQGLLQTAQPPQTGDADLEILKPPPPRPGFRTKRAFLFA